MGGLPSSADYLIYDRKTQAKELAWLNTVVDSNVPEYDIGRGYFAAKLLDKQPKNTQFDNGLFRIVSNDDSLKVDSFKTNWSTNSELTFNATTAGILYFELFPQKNLKYYLNGTEIQAVYLKTGLASFPFLPGKNQFVVSYHNAPLTFFLYTYFIYLIIVAFILIGYTSLIVAACFRKHMGNPPVAY